MDICTVKNLLEVLTALFAAGAACWWFAAAWAGWFPYVSKPWGEIERYMKWQAMFNGIAATCAGIAAIMQCSHCIFCGLPRFRLISANKHAIAATNRKVSTLAGQRGGRHRIMPPTPPTAPQPVARLSARLRPASRVDNRICAVDASPEPASERVPPHGASSPPRHCS